MASSIDVSVIITSFNNLYTLQFVLETFSHQNISNFEVIVGDNGSQDGTVEWLSDKKASGFFPFDLYLVENSKKGFGIASVNNLCAKSARGRRFLFTNADVLHSSESVESHAKLAKDVMGCGIITGIGINGVSLVNLAVARNFVKLLSLACDFPTRRANTVFLCEEKPTHLMCWGGNFSIHREDFELLGGYDEGFDVGWGGEDTDLARRALDASLDLQWVKDSIGVHLDHPSNEHKEKALGRKLYLEKHKDE